MQTYCVHIPREKLTQSRAIKETAWNVTKGRVFEQLLDELHDTIQEVISFELFCEQQTVNLCFHVREDLADSVTVAIQSVLPDCEIHPIDDYTSADYEGMEIMTAEVRLARDDIFPLQTYSTFKYDSLVPIVNTISQFPPDEKCIVQICTKGLPDSALLQMDLLGRRSSDRIRHFFRLKYWFKKGVGGTFPKITKEKCDTNLFSVNMRVAVMRPQPSNTSHADNDSSATDGPNLKERLRAVIGAFAAVNTLDLNSIVMKRIRSGERSLAPFQRRLIRKGFRLNAKELSTLWHPVGLDVVPNTTQILSKKIAAPKQLPIDDGNTQVSLFGTTTYRNRAVPFGIDREDRRRHMYVVGKSGSGKSCLLQLLVKSDVEAGHGVAVLDPHGDLVDDLLKLIPRHRMNDVVLLDPADRNFPASFNPLAQVSEQHRVQAAASMVEIFRKVAGAEWSELMEHLLRYSLLALMSTSGTTLLSLRKFLIDEEYRRSILTTVRDESVRSFWENEYESRRAEFHEQAANPLLNRIGQLFATDMVRNVLGQPLNRFHFREFMDQRKIVLMKVSKGLLGDSNSALLGAMVINRIFHAALSRGDVVEEDREDFYFYIDEFHNFATEGFGELLSGSRKYHLCLTLVNQFLGQLPKTVRTSVFGNVGSILSFRVGGDDAAVLSKEFGSNIDALDMINLGLRDFYVKMMIGGELQGAFSGRTLDVRLPRASDWSRDECLEYSRTHYALPIDRARDMLSLWEEAA